MNEATNDCLSIICNMKVSKMEIVNLRMRLMLGNLWSKGVYSFRKNRFQVFIKIITQFKVAVLHQIVIEIESH